MQITPIYLAGQTARMMGLKVDIISGRDKEHQAAWLNGYARAVPLQARASGNGCRVLQFGRGA
jgi:hypothetical protein